MQIVIDIPEDLYEECKRLGDKRDTLFESIRNATPLPKGHGRLIDADKAYILDVFTLREFDGQFIRLKDLDKIPTIIERSDSE